MAYGYNAFGYGFLQDMPYVYIHKFTRTSMTGKIQRFEGEYMHFWKKLCEMLLIEVHSNIEVLAVKGVVELGLVCSRKFMVFQKRL